MPLQFGILGPLEARVDGRRLELGGPRPRRLLSALLLDASDVVSVDRLVHAVWDGDPPARVDVTLRAHVAKLRRALASVAAAAPLVTRPPGYALELAPEQVDAARFERLVAGGRAALDRGDAEDAADTLRQALGLWRGQVLEDLDTPAFAEAEAARLEELRLVALEARVDADLALGAHRELIGELEALVRAQPFREPLCAQLMLALYRSGRQTDALAVARGARQRLGDELGLDPGAVLVELETAILRHDPALRLPQGVASTPGGAPAPSQPPSSPARALTAAADGPAPRSPSTDALLDVVRRVTLAGRQTELERLRALWQAVRAGGRRLALVSGEAGVGKTRLVAELAELAAGDGATVLVGHCDPETLIPYQPVADALGSAGLAWPDAPAAGRRSALFDAVTEVFDRVAETAPVVLVVEEAEGIDPASAHLLSHLARRLPARMLVVACFRDPPGSTQPPLRGLLADLEGRGLADRLVLGPLAEAELAALVAIWTGEEAPAGFVHALWASTGGNPFFASEVVRDLLARGGGVCADDARRVPAGVRDVLRERLRTLSPAAQDVVACAAMLGREAELGLLTRVADHPEGDVVEALQEAARAGWLVETTGSWRLRYTFRHALMREAVHADTPAPQRQRLHLRAADALDAASVQRGANVAAAAGHLRAAGGLVDPQRTADVSLQAADAAAGVYAWDEAVAHAEAAVAILAEAGAPPARRADAAMRAARLLEQSSLDYRRAVEHLQAAREHYRAAGDAAGGARMRSRLGHVLSIHHSVMDVPQALEHFAAAAPVLTDGAAAFEVAFGEAMGAGFGLQVARGWDAGQRALQLAEALGEPALVGWGRAALACFPLCRGELAAERAIREEAWAAASDLGDPHLGWDVAVCGAAFANTYLLDPAEGHAWCRRAFAQPRLDTVAAAFDAIRDQQVYALASMGALAAARDAAGPLAPDAVSRRWLRLLDGDWEAAERSWAVAFAHDLDTGNLLNATVNAAWLAQARWLLGRDAEAVAALEHALAIGLDGPHVPAELMARAELVRILAAQGAVDEAAEHLAGCDKILAAGEDWRGRAGAVELARGAVAAAQGEHDLADATHRTALEVFTAYRLPWQRAETLRAWGHWLAASGRAVEADARCRAACELYATLDAHARWQSASAPATPPRR